MEISREKLLEDYDGSCPQVTWAKNGLAGENPLIESFRGRIESLWQEACDSCQTNKARIDKMLEILPEDLRSPHITIPIGQEKELRQTIERLVGQEKNIGLRTCFAEGREPVSGTSPWAMGLKNNKDIEKFFQETYPQWRQIPNLQEIIVMSNPQELGDKSLLPNHFVFRVEAFSPRELRVELRIGTEHLRAIEAETERQDLIEIKMEVPHNFYGIYSPGQIIVTPGQAYLNTSFIPKGMNQFLTDNGIVWSGKEDTQLIINAQPLMVINKVIKTVFDKWTRSPKENIYYLLLALKKFDLNSLEFQGYHDLGKVKWIKAYGFRGIREEKVPPFVIRKLDGD